MPYQVIAEFCLRSKRDHFYNLKNEIIELKSEQCTSRSRMIPANHNQFQQGFKSHLAASKKIQGVCSHLLLFYAAECGIKSIWLRRKNLRKTDDIGAKDIISKHGHNLAEWQKELKIPANQVKQSPHFDLAKGESSLDISKAHEAWRYNISMKPQDQKALVEWLESLCDWIKENINQ